VSEVAAGFQPAENHRWFWIPVQVENLHPLRQKWPQVSEVAAGFQPAENHRRFWIPVQVENLHPL
jgi:hypothetical protein